MFNYFLWCFPGSDLQQGELSTHGLSEGTVALKAGTGCTESELSLLYPAGHLFFYFYFPLFSTRLVVVQLASGRAAPPVVVSSVLELLRWRPTSSSPSLLASSLHEPAFYRL